MKIIVKCKINPDKKQINILDKTLCQCLKVLNYVSKIAWKQKCFNNMALHYFTYYKIKSKFKLTSQICCALNHKVAYSYKINKKEHHIFKNPILPLNFTRTLSLKDFKIASISTIQGRQKIPLILGEYQKQMFAKAIKFCDSELIKQRDKFYLNICIEIPDEPLKKTTDIIGIDIGIKNIATCSTGDNFTGKQVQSVRNKYQTLRAKLQSKGTRSAKRHLKKMSGKEKRFQKSINHTISKQIVNLANQHNSALALENLTNIRKTTRHRKAYKTIFNRWAFSQLRNFINYKAQKQGIPVILVNPAFTSQVCSSCGNLGIRNGQNFHCPFCSHKSDADYNASRNIRNVAINQRIVICDDVKGSAKNNCDGALLQVLPS